MAYAFVQQKENSVNGTGQASIASGNFGSSVTAGNLIFVIGFYGSASVKTITWSDTLGMTFFPIGNLFNATDQFGLIWGYYKNISGGTESITATFSANVDFPAILATEYSGLDTVAPYTSGETASQRQAAPGTGANAITSGNTPTLATQPCAVIGFSQSANGIDVPTAGTGYTSRTSVWTFGGANPAGRPEDKRVTATTAVAATFSATVGLDNYGTLVAVFKEQSTATPFVAGEIPNPRRTIATIAPLIAGSLLLTTLATPNVKPVGKAQFPDRFPSRAFMVSEHYERTDVGQAPAGPMPFGLYDWPNPRGARPVTAGITTSFRNVSQPANVKPLGQSSFPNPGLRSTGSVSEHFSRADTGTPPPVLTFPFSQTDWTNPRGKASFKTPVIFRLDPDVAQDIPFAQSDFPNPTLRKPQALTWTQDLLQSTLAPANVKPFNQSDFPNPRGYTPAITLRTGNDTRTILMPVGPQPFGQSDWPVPKGYNPVISLKTLTDSSLLFQPPNIQPFGQSDWQNPKGSIPAIALKDGNYSVTITLPPGPIPPPPVIVDSSTPGRLKRHDWWKTKDQVEKEQKKPAPKIEKVEIAEEEVTSETVKVALERTRATVKALGAQVNEEGVKRPRKESVALEKQLLEAQQQELLLATQQAVLLEEQEISDIAYIAMMVMQQEE